MIAAGHVIFCFGTSSLKPEMLAVRLRSIRVAEYADRLVLSFLEPPLPAANEAIENSVKVIVHQAHERPKSTLGLGGNGLRVANGNGMQQTGRVRPELRQPASISSTTGTDGEDRAGETDLRGEQLPAETPPCSLPQKG